MLLFSVLCFLFMAKRSCNAKAMLALQPCVYTGKLRAHVLRPRSRREEPGVYTKVHSLSEHCKRTVKAKEGNDREALSVLPFGNGLRHTRSLPAHGHYLIQGWCGAKADPGIPTAQQCGQAGDSEPLPVLL